MYTLCGPRIPARTLIYFRSRPDGCELSGLYRAPAFDSRLRQFRLEIQLQRKLPDASRQSSSNLPEGCRCGQAPAETGDPTWRQELRVVEDIKKFSPELEIKAFCDLRVF